MRRASACPGGTRAGPEREPSGARRLVRHDARGPRAGRSAAHRRRTWLPSSTSGSSRCRPRTATTQATSTRCASRRRSTTSSGPTWRASTSSRRDRRSSSGASTSRTTPSRTCRSIPGKPPNSVEDRKNWGFAVGHDAGARPEQVQHRALRLHRHRCRPIGLQTAPAADFRFIDGLDCAQRVARPQAGDEQPDRRLLVDQGLAHAEVRHQHALDEERQLRQYELVPYLPVEPVVGARLRRALHARRHLPGAGRLQRPARRLARARDRTTPTRSCSCWASSPRPTRSTTTPSTAACLASAIRCRRLWASDEYEFYAHDSWRVADTLTVTAGVRYSLFSPPYEANGVQVAPIAEPRRLVRRARSEHGPGHSRRTPASSSRSTRPARRTTRPASIRGTRTTSHRGCRRPGRRRPRRSSAAATPSSTTASARASRRRSTPAGRSACRPISTTPFGTVNERSRSGGAVPWSRTTRRRSCSRTRPTGGFPQTPPVGGRRHHAEHRQLDRDALLARLQLRGRPRSRQGLRHRSGVRRATRTQSARSPRPRHGAEPDRPEVWASTTSPPCVSSSTRRPTASRAWRPIPYWENLFPDAAGGGLSATQAMADSFQANAPDYITALWDADQYCYPACSAFGPFAYFAEQYDSLASRSTIGRSEYDALQLTLRKRYSAGLPVRLQLHPRAREGSHLGGRARRQLRQLRARAATPAS